jgi:two-component system sensor histidine kinase/response regulator
MDPREPTATIDTSPPIISDQGTLRMIQVGCVIIIGLAILDLFSLLQAGGAVLSWSSGSILFDLAMGCAILLMSRSAWFLRNWAPIVWIMLATITGNDLLLGIAGGEPILLFISLMLLIAGTGSLLPWSASFQGSISLVCLAAWGVQQALAPASDHNGTYRTAGLIGAAGLAQFACYVRVRYVREHEQSQRRTKESETALREIFDANTDSITVVDLETRLIVDVNAGFLRHTGYSREEAVGRTSHDLGIWADLENEMKFAREVVARRPVLNMSVDVCAKDGRRFPCLVSSAFVNIQGRPCVMSLSRDVSDIRSSEEKLKQSEEMLRKVFDANLDSMSITDVASYKYVEVNREFVRSTGFSREELVGKSCEAFELWPSDQLANYRLALTEKGEVRNMQVDVTLKNGAVEASLVSGVVFEIGGHLRCLTLRRDISELKAATEKLRNSEAMLREIFDSSLDNMSLIDLSDGSIIDVNKELLRSMGYTKEEVLGKSLVDLAWADSSQQNLIATALREHGQVRNYPTTFRARDGRLIPVLISAAVLELNGRLCAISIGRDVTDLEAAREAALTAAKAKSEFFSSMSHEIRTPMNAILGMADLLGESNLNPEQRRYLDTVISNGNALLELINSILDLAKVESGRLNLEAAEFDLFDLTERVADGLAVRAHEKQVELAMRFAPDLAANWIGDRLRLRQVMTNLIGNAIKFTERGEVIVSVSRNHDLETPGNILFAVRDTGIGIEQDKLLNVFSVFTQADSSITRKYGGTGLGLAIVQRLVTLMGGRVWVESEVGKGSTFYFTIDLSAPESSIVELPAYGEPELRGIRTLVIGENAATRSILAEMMIESGASVVEASSGELGVKAVEVALREGASFGLLIIDTQPSPTDHLQMLRLARQTGRHRMSIVMLMDSNNLTAKLIEMRELGVKHYVVKPIKRAEFYSAIKASLLSCDATTPVAVEPESPAAPATALGQQVMNRPLHLLLADDSPDNRLLIRAYLKKTGYVLDEVENGRLALERFAHGRYDLVLMDIQMPVLDGYSAVSAIRKWEIENHRTRTPIVALSASALEEDVRRAKEVGCDLHVSKPVKKSTLLDAIARMALPRESAIASESAAPEGFISPAPIPVDSL